MSRDSGQCCHWSIAVLARFHDNRPHAMNRKPWQHNNFCVRIGRFLYIICLYHSRRDRQLVNEATGSRLSATAGVTFFSSQRQCSVQWTTEAPFAQTWTVPFSWVGPRSGTFTNEPHQSSTTAGTPVLQSRSRQTHQTAFAVFTLTQVNLSRDQNSFGSTWIGGVWKRPKLRFCVVYWFP